MNENIKLLADYIPIFFLNKIVAYILLQIFYFMTIFLVDATAFFIIKLQ